MDNLADRVRSASVLVSAVTISNLAGSSAGGSLMGLVPGEEMDE